MAVGAFQWMNAALNKFTANGPMDLDSDTFHAVLCDTTEALTTSFTGTSTDCRYADLAHELSTSNGYTVNGTALSGLSLTRSANVVKWTANPWSWTITSTGISFQYVVIVNWTTTNKDILAFADCSGGGNLNILAGALQFTPNANGVLEWRQ